MEDVRTRRGADIYSDPHLIQQALSLTGPIEIRINYDGGQQERDQRSTNFNVSGGTGPRTAPSYGMDLHQNPGQEDSNYQQRTSAEKVKALAEYTKGNKQVKSSIIVTSRNT
ncbi:unnamed protein product [Schistosoma margrebowiei]|uniref:Uncharacterized protein n=1 Tax=Schistosoma margrebowiei TaxID=48269 RepID=A0A183LUU4_9TREM|nr:unnamed protein product [Schistosoma margrebowiei]